MVSTPPTSTPSDWKSGCLFACREIWEFTALELESILA
jgi:hypothetical protein